MKVNNYDFRKFIDVFIDKNIYWHIELIAMITGKEKSSAKRIMQVSGKWNWSDPLRMYPE